MLGCGEVATNGRRRLEEAGLMDSAGIKVIRWLIDSAGIRLTKPCQHLPACSSELAGNEILASILMCEAWTFLDRFIFS